MTKDAEKPTEYGAQSIRVMEGLEAVRKRPGMYIGTTDFAGLHHLVYEVVDNSVDESLAGYCNKIKIILHEDGSCSVEDNGRGIPTDIHPTEGISAAEVVLTKLHAGGKFDKDSYKYSGGLHGVGVSVVNALSSLLILEIYKNGQLFHQEYKRGKPVAPLALIGTTEKQHGTYVRFYPDNEIFADTNFNFDTLSTRLRELAFLNKGLKISIHDEKNNKDHIFFFEGGIISFVQYINDKKTPLFDDVIYLFNENDTYILELAMQYNDTFGEQLYSFVNNINTIDGGTHVAGFKSALTKVCNKRAQALGITKDKDSSFSSEDVREGLVAVINIKIPEPQFEGQTKAKLGNSEIKGIIDSWVFASLDTYFEENPAIIKKIIQKAELARRARDAAKKARELTRRKTVLENTILPGKLADCTDENPANTELFIVEGDSAGGSAKQGRDRYTQAILPLKGKILNVEKARLDKMLSNDEIKAIISATGAGIGDDFIAERVRYHKIILMTDADVDGSHIRTLLLTFFFRYMRPVIDRGYLYIAQPPLYKAKIGKKEEYLKDERAFKQFLFDWAKEQLQLTVNKIVTPYDEFEKILADTIQYETALDKLCTIFKITNSQGHKLLCCIATYNLSNNTDTTTIFNALNQYFSKFIVNKTEVISTILDEKPKIIFSFSITNKSWEITEDFFHSKEINIMLNLLAPLNQITNSWELTVIEKNKSLQGNGFIQFLNGITTLSKPYMHIQRYKGLGEMNPEQLWETSMNSKTRSLLQISVQDALEADTWFSTLMGDDVAGRRDFIETNGRFVKNLDV